MRTLPFDQTDPINQRIKKNSVISEAFPSALIEWNMNNCFPTIGVNLVNAGDNAQSLGMSGSETNHQFAGRWRETSGLTGIIATNNSSIAPKLYTSRTSNRLIPSSEGFSYWISPQASLGSSWKANAGESASSIAKPVVHSAPQSAERVEVIGVMTSGEVGAKVKLLVRSNIADYTNKVISIPKEITVSQWNDKSKRIALSGSYAITSSGKSFFKDVVWGTTRPNQKLIKLASYRKYTSFPGQSLRNLWGGTIKSTSVKINTDNSPPGAFFVDVEFNESVTSAEQLLSQRVWFESELEWIEIDLAASPRITVTNLSNSELYDQITSVEPVVCQIVTSVSSEATLNTRLASVGRSGGGRVILGSNITLTKPIVIPPNTELDLNGFTITAGSSFSPAYTHAIFLQNPEVSIGTASATGGSAVITGTLSPAPTPGQEITITYSKDLETLSAERFKIISVSGSTYTLDKNIFTPFSSAAVTTSASYNASTTNVSIVNGTISISSSLSSLGAISAVGANSLLLANLNISGVKVAPAVEIDACSNVRITGNTISADTVGISMVESLVGSVPTSCKNVFIGNNTITSTTAISSSVSSPVDTENHFGVGIMANQLSGTLNMKNVDELAVLNNTINSLSNGIKVASFRRRSSSIIIANNTFSTSLAQIVIAGESLGSNIYLVRISNNSGITTVPQISNAAMVSYFDNPSAPTALAGWLGKTANIVYGAAPTTILSELSVDVLAYSKNGLKINILTQEAVTKVLPGDWVVVSGVHPSIDGARRVLSCIPQGKGSQLYLEASSSGDISQSFANSGKLSTVTFKPVNSISAKFEKSYGLPNSIIVQGLTKNGWIEIATSSALSQSPEKDIVVDDNIRSMRINYNGSWTSDDIVLSADISIELAAVRLVIQACDTSKGYVSVAEVSPRLCHTIDDDIISLSIDKSLSSESTAAPVGQSSANTGTIDLANDHLLYSPSNDKSPLKGLFVKNAVAHMYMNYGLNRVKLGTMIVDEWDESGRESATVSLVDKSKILQDAKSRNIFLYSYKNPSGEIDLTSSIQSLLSASGIGGTIFLGKPSPLKAFYSRASNTIWDTLKSLLEPFQAAAYFDEYGRLQVMYRDYIYPEVEYVGGRCYQASGKNYIDIVGDASLTPLPNSYVSLASDYTTDAKVVAVSGRTLEIDTPFPTGIDTIRISNSTRNVNYVVGDDKKIPNAFSDSEIDTLSPDGLSSFSQDTFEPSSITAQALPPSGVMARRFTKLHEYVLDSYSRSGSTVSLEVFQASTGVKQIVNGDTVFVSNTITGIDTSSATVTSVSGQSVQYSLSGSSSVPLSKNTYGLLGFTSGTIRLRATNLTPGQQYEFNAKAAKSADFGLAVTTSAQSSETFTVVNSSVWVPIKIKFIADQNSHEILITSSEISYGDWIGLVDESLSLVGTESLDVWRGEVFSMSQNTLDTASKVEVSYKSINPYSERSTNIEGQREVGQNSELWRMEDFILPVFLIDPSDLSSGEFKFENKAMNLDTAIDAFNDTATAYAWIPYSGKFSIVGDTSGKRYEYEALEADIFAPLEQGVGSRQFYRVSNSEDYIDARNLNLGRPPRWTMRGFMKKQYGIPQETSTSTPPKINIQFPFNSASRNAFNPIYAEPKETDLGLLLPYIEQPMKTRIGNMLEPNVATGGDTLQNASSFVIQAGSGGSLDYITTDKFSGSGCIQFTADSGAYAIAIHNFPSYIQATPGTEYTFSALVKSSAARSMQMRLQWRDSTGAAVGSQLALDAVATNGTWQRLVGTVTAPSGATQANPFILIDSSTIGETFLIDHVGMWPGPDGQWSGSNDTILVPTQSVPSMSSLIGPVFSVYDQNPNTFGATFSVNSPRYGATAGILFNVDEFANTGYFVGVGYQGGDWIPTAISYGQTTEVIEPESNFKTLSSIDITGNQITNWAYEYELASLMKIECQVMYVGSKAVIELYVNQNLLGKFSIDAPSINQSSRSCGFVGTGAKMYLTSFYYAEQTNAAMVSGGVLSKSLPAPDTYYITRVVREANPTLSDEQVEVLATQKVASVHRGQSIMPQVAEILAAGLPIETREFYGAAPASFVMVNAL